MGYYYHYHSANIRIPAALIDSAASALKPYAAEYHPEISSDLSSSDFIRAVAEENRYGASVNADGDILVSHPWDEIKGSDKTYWLSPMAAQIAEGSYIEIRNDDDQVYRVVFYGEQMARVSPIWPGKESVIKQIAD